MKSSCPTVGSLLTIEIGIRRRARLPSVPVCNAFWPKNQEKSKIFEKNKNVPNGTKCIVNVPKCCFGAFSSIFERTSDTAAPAQPAPVVARPPQGRGGVKTQDYQNSKKIENFEHFPNAAKCIVNPAKRYFRPFWTIFAPFGPTTAELFFLANAVRPIFMRTKLLF